jgi:hypothetical protein
VKNLITWTSAAMMAAVLVPGRTAQASSHRESLAVLGDPCIDTTDMYAWVSPGNHDRTYLIMNLNGLHEPGQGNHQTKLCEDVRYAFHIVRGAADLQDDLVYYIQFTSTVPARQNPADLNIATNGPIGGDELLIQLSGIQQTYTVYKAVTGGLTSLIGNNLPVTPPNIGPKTDRVAYGLGMFDPRNPSHHSQSLYNDAFAARYIRPLGNNGSEGRAWVGTRDDPFYLDEKGIFDTLNLAGVPPQGRNPTELPGEDVFAGFNVNTIALEVPTREILGLAPNAPLPTAPGNNSMFGVWFSTERRRVTYRRSGGQEPIHYGDWVQTSRQAHPLINAAVIGVQDQAKFLRTTPATDVTNFGAYFLYPVLARDIEILGIYNALGVGQGTIDEFVGRTAPRTDIIDVINLTNFPTMGAHSIPLSATGDVIRIDAAVDASYPNGRSLQGSMPDREQADVSDVLLTVIITKGAVAVGDSVNHNDKPYLTEFPFAPLPWVGLTQGHGAPAPN